jgi:hypothetical protein
LDPDSGAPVADEDTLQFVDRLTSTQKFADAVKVLANALTKSAAIAWAYACVRDCFNGEISDRQKQTLLAVETWLRDPSEANRRACFKAAEVAGFNTAAGCLAMAAFGTSGSLGPENVPAVPPPEGFAAHMASGAVMLGLTQRPPQDAASGYEDFIQRGKAIAQAA